MPGDQAGTKPRRVIIDPPGHKFLSFQKKPLAILAGNHSPPLRKVLMVVAMDPNGSPVPDVGPAGRHAVPRRDGVMVRLVQVAGVAESAAHKGSLGPIGILIRHREMFRFFNRGQEFRKPELSHP